MQETALCLPEKKDTQEVCAVCSLTVLPSLKHTCEAQLGGVCAVPRQVVGGGLCHTMARALSSSHLGRMLPVQVLLAPGQGAKLLNYQMDS